MCKKNNPRRIDPCIKELIRNLNWIMSRWKPVGSCCGHGRYPMTIVVQIDKYCQPYELMHGIWLDRKTKFYKKDSKGYYFIPEVQQCVKKGRMIK